MSCCFSSSPRVALLSSLSLYGLGSPSSTRNQKHAFVYVTNQGSFGEGNTVSVIDTATNTVVATVAVGSGPNAVAVTPDGAFAYVGNTSTDTISVISTATNTVVATIVGPGNPRGIAITPDGRFAYVTNT